MVKRIEIYAWENLEMIFIPVWLIDDYTWMKNDIMKLWLNWEIGEW